MAKGRPPDPGRAKRSTGHRPLPGQAKAMVPALAVGEVAGHATPPPPESLPEAARELWRIVCEDLLSRGLREADLPLVEMLCVSLHRCRRARAHIEKYGELVTYRGAARPYANPMLRIERDSALLYLRLAETLGLSPAARVRLGFLQLAGQSLLVGLAERVKKAATP